MKPLLTQGENSVLEVAKAVCDVTETTPFAKMRIADVVRIEGSGISDDLYRYALSAHFDVLIAKHNKAFLAIEFDGAGHAPANDAKKALLCDRFGIPMVRVTEKHLDAKQFGDTAVGFFIWQLFCVDAFLAEYGSDSYERYDPYFFASIPGKSRNWPFAYSERWRARLERPFRAAADKFDSSVRDFYAHGILQFGTIFSTFHKGLECCSVYAQRVGRDQIIFGEAELAVEIHGLAQRRFELFGEIATFTEGLAAEKMYRQGMAFLEGNCAPTSEEYIRLKSREWKANGFKLSKALNVKPW